MNRVTLNLATRPFRNNTVVGSIFLGVTVLVLAASVYNGYVFTNYEGRFQDLKSEEARHRERLSALETEERKLSKEIAARNFKQLFGRGEFAAELIMRRAFSWTLLFNKLEGVVPAEVMMTAIRPNISGERIVVRVEGIAKRHEALRTLYDTLLKNPSFGRVDPKSERRLNPSRPEISFVLQFDYVPSGIVPGPDAVASGAAEGGLTATPEGTPQASIAAAGTPQAVPAASATPAATPPPGIAGGTTPGAPAAGAPPGPAGLESPPVIGTVGRDGRPRTPEILARLVAAPGGFYPDVPPAVPPGPMPAKRSKGRPAETQPAMAAAPATAPAMGGKTETASGTPPPTPGKTAPGAVRPAAGTRDPATGRPPVLWQNGAAPAPAGPLRAAGHLPPRRDPKLGPPAAAKRGKPAATSRPVEPIPATRLDLALNFKERPVQDVYAALSRAHGVRFDLDPTVDTGARLSADLEGKNLKQAISVVSKLAGHRVSRVQDGVYRVVPLAGGEPLADGPVQEEALPAQVKP